MSFSIRKVFNHPFHQSWSFQRGDRTSASPCHVFKCLGFFFNNVHLLTPHSSFKLSEGPKQNPLLTPHLYWIPPTRHLSPHPPFTGLLSLRGPLGGGHPLFFTSWVCWLTVNLRFSFSSVAPSFLKFFFYPLSRCLPVLRFAFGWTVKLPQLWTVLA